MYKISLVGQREKFSVNVILYIIQIIFYYRLRLERSGHHVTATVEHCSGNIVLCASTQEWAVKKHLYSTKDAMACENVGRILSQRCLEAGLHFMLFREIPWVFRSESVRCKADFS